MEQNDTKILKDLEKRVKALEEENKKKDRIINRLSSTVNKLSRQLKSAKVKVDNSRSDISLLNSKINRRR